MIWITNHPKPIESFWPRRKDVVYTEGEVVEASETFPKRRLEELGYIGIYADVESREEYYKKELIRGPQKSCMS